MSRWNILFIAVRSSLILTTVTICDGSYTYERIGNGLYFVGQGNTEEWFDWFDARKSCWDHHGQLVSVQTETKMMELQNYIVSKGYANASTFATSGNSLSSEYPFRWSAMNQKLTYKKWLAGEGPRLRSSLSLQLIGTELYMIRSSGLDNYYICEYETIWQTFWMYLQNPYIILILASLLWAFSVVICKRIRAAQHRLSKVSETKHKLLILTLV